MSDSVSWMVPFFLDHQKPHGNLDPAREAHALWFYYLHARREYERFTGQIPTMVAASESNAPMPEPDWRRLFCQCAEMYRVQPEHMANCWDQVDAECLRVGLPLMPRESCYRFNAPHIVTLGDKHLH